VRKPDAYPHCRQSDDDVGPTMTHRRVERTACGDQQAQLHGTPVGPAIANCPNRPTNRLLSRRRLDLPKGARLD